MNAKFIDVRSRAKGFILPVVSLIVIGILYWMLFRIALPPQFIRQGISLMDESLVFVLFALLFFAYRYQGRIAKYLRLLCVLFAFTLPLLRLWQTAESTWNIVLGLLPWADAAGYYWDAGNLIDGHLFSVFSGRRPLFASLLAVFLKLSDQNLQIVLIIFLTINGVAAFLFTEEIQEEFGPLSAIAAAYLLHFFYRPFVGTTLTEQFGLPVGLLAFTVLLRAVRNSWSGLFALGLSLTMFALLIRAGTFFVLPILIALGVFRFGKHRQRQLRTFVLLAGAVCIPILFNIWLGRTVASSNSIPFGNFADTLYGQAIGGARWTQAVVDYPELTTMPEPDRSRLLYHLAFEEILTNPLGLVRGAIKAWKDFIFPGPLSAFGFVAVGNKNIDLILQLSATLVFLSGIWLLWIDRQNSISALVLAYWTGTFLSIPFLPPIDAGIRPYTGTIASVILPVVHVFSRSLFLRDKFQINTRQPVSVEAIFVLALILILTSLIGGPFIKWTARPPLTQIPDCDSGLVALNFRLFDGSYVSIQSADPEQRTRVPNVLITDIRRSFDDFPYGDLAGVLRRVRQTAIIATTNELSTGAGLWIIAPPELKSRQGQMISACAEVVLPQYSMMVIKTVSYTD